MKLETVTAYGSFVKRNGHIFRTSAYLQWGDSTDSLGACLLLNPGSARLIEGLDRELDSQGLAEGEIKMDPTMESQLVKIVERIHQQNGQLSGRFYIYNLFNLREGKSEKEINDFETLCGSNLYNIEDSLASVEELKQHPWILLGWGVNKKQRWIHLQTSKERWLHRLSQAQIPIIGKLKVENGEYYHPLPRLVKNRAGYIEDILKQYQQQNG